MSRSQLSLLLLIAATLLFCNCSKSSNVDDEDSDRTPPEAVTDLAISSVSSHRVVLQWTAPHDYRDDNSNGMVDEYDLRISYDSITPANFAAAYHLDSIPMPAPAGNPQQCEIEELEPDSAYCFAIKSRDSEGNWSLISNCCRAHCPPIQIVSFADTALERLIRNHIHKADGDILSTDVDTITYLGAGWLGITSIAGLEYFTSLLGINLQENDIADISPLANANHMWTLNLASNNVSDISPLAGLPALIQLQIGDNPITNIDALSAIPSLQQLFMFATSVTDFSPLYGLEHLTDLHLAMLNLTDISFMSNLTHVRICKLNSNNITSITPLSGLTTMEGLDLLYNNISDVSPLTLLTNLNSLNLGYNQVTNIQALVNNSGLGEGDFLVLTGNPLSQEAIDVQIPALQSRGVTVTL